MLFASLFLKFESSAIILFKPFLFQSVFHIPLFVRKHLAPIDRPLSYRGFLKETQTLHSLWGYFTRWRNIDVRQKRQHALTYIVVTDILASNKY